MWKWNLREGSLRALLNTAAEPRLSPTLHLFPWGLLLLHPGVLLVHRHHGQRRHARHHAVHGPVPAVPCNSVTCHVSRVTCRVWARVTCGRRRVVRRVERVRHELLQRGLGADEAHLPVRALTCTQPTIIRGRSHITSAAITRQGQSECWQTLT